MQDKISVGNFLASKDGKGVWSYTSKELPAVKKVIKKYKEKPQFELQEQIEGNSKAKFKIATNNTILKILKFIK